MSNTSPAEPRWPSPAAGWWMVGVLFFAYIVSFVDRSILSLLVSPIQADLGLSDVQIGLLGGLAFGSLYAILGLPMGLLVDRGSRKGVILLGVFIWGLATAACGLAGGFAWLFAARVLVGAGEAALSPAAFSLLADLFPPHRRAFPSSVFVMAGSVGGGLALALGGLLIGWLGDLGPISIGRWTDIPIWRVTFLAVAAPAILVMALVAVTPEPHRMSETPPTEAATCAASARPAWSVLVPLTGAMSMLSLVAYGYLAWLPAHFERAFGWPASIFGPRFGLVFLIMGAAGALAGGLLTQRWRRHDASAGFRVVALGLTALAPFAVAASLMRDPVSALVLLAPVMFLIAFPSGVAAAVVQDVTPGAWRGRTTAAYYAAMNLLGLSIGAPLIAYVGQAAPGSTQALGPAMAFVGAGALILGSGLAWRARAAAQRALRHDR